MEDVSKINQTEGIVTDRQSSGAFEHKKGKKRKHAKAAKKHLSELQLIVDETHKELERKKSPFRLCVYQEGEDIYIDIVTIDNLNRVQQVFRHDISHDELEDLIIQIKSGRGLLLDADA